MKQLIVGYLCSMVAVLAQAQHQDIYPQQSGAGLLDALVQGYKPQWVLDYDDARDTLYAKIYLESDSVEGVYTGHKLYLPFNQDPSTTLYRSGNANGINTEHTYPQSKGARYGAAKSDMHHLYPTRTAANSARANYPFAIIPAAQTTSWYYRNWTEATPSQATRKYSQVDSNNGLFTPRLRHRGNVARAIFYFYTMYKAEADAADPTFFASQIPHLCQWHFDDPVDSLEWVRTHRIATYQDGKPNPFVLACPLPVRTYCPHLSSSCLVSAIPLADAGMAWATPYPQPAHSKVTFEYTLNQASTLQLNIYDVLGKVVYAQAASKKSAGSHQTTINVSTLQAGYYTYCWKVQSGGQYYPVTGKLVIQR